MELASRHSSGAKSLEVGLRLGKFVVSMNCCMSFSHAECLLFKVQILKSHVNGDLLSTHSVS